MLKIILLKKEYLTTISGQKELVDMINSHETNCLKMSETGLAVGTVIMEAEQCCTFSNDLIKSLFFGEKHFEYKYSIWECELNCENVSYNQIKEYLKSTNPKLTDDDIEDNINYSTFHDAVDLKYIDADKAKEISENISLDMLKDEIEKLEQEMETQGISFTNWNDEENISFLNELLLYAKNAAKEGTGILYANFIYEL